MIKNVAHIGLTVSDLNRSVEFYKNILGMEFLGHLTMSGPSTDKLFNYTNCIVELAYLSGSESLTCPPIELIQFVSPKEQKDQASLFKTSISELCFYVEDIDLVYQELKAKGVEFLSEPQYFNFTEYGFDKSKAVYFKDPDGIILELMQKL